MKKFVFIITQIFLFAIPFCVIGQVGINGSDPQESLHVFGDGSAIRVEGLNSANNVNNLGGVNLYNALIDETGTLRLNPQSGLLSSDSRIISPIEIQSTTFGGYNSDGLYQYNFTLQKRAMVVITYYIAIEFKSFSGSRNIIDGRTKIAENFFYLGDGSTEDSSTSYGLSSINYFNYNCETARGYIYNSQSCIITLDAGTHSIHMKGAVFGGGTNTVAAFTGTFGNYDRLDISVIYL